MKKFIISIAIILISIASYGQAKINRAGPANTVVDQNLNAANTFIMPYFNDTTLATVGLDSCGKIFYNRGTASVWYRACIGYSSRKWIEISVNSSPTISAWLTRGNDLSTQSLPNRLGTKNGDLLNIITSDQIRAIIPAGGIVRSSSAQNRYLMQDTVGKEIYYGDFGGNLTPTWQRTLTEGSTLTGDNSILLSGFALEFQGDGSDSYNILGVNNFGVGDFNGTRISVSQTETLIASPFSSGRSSFIDIHTDSLWIKPSLGNFIIDTINNETFQNVLMGWTSSGVNRGKVGYIIPGNAISLGDGIVNVANQREIEYISTNTFTALTGYTAVGSPTYSISGGKVVFTGAGAAGAYTKYIKNDLGVLTEQNTLQATITIDAAPDAASYGVAIGFKSYSAYCPTATVIGGIVTATGGNFGKLFIYGDYGAQLNYGPTNTDLNNGDVIRISMSNNGWKWSLLVQNFTQGWEERQDLETADGGFVPLLGNNSANPAFFHMGGNISIDSFHYTVHAPLSTDIMFIGNSIVYGQDADTQFERLVNMVGNTESNIFSGGGCDVTQSIIDRLPEIIAINPKRVILHDIAGNDIAQALDSATVWAPNLRTIRNTLAAAGIPIIWTNGQPRTGLDESPQKNYIESEPQFAGDLIIDTWTPMLGTGTDPYALFMSDATHPNNIGMRVVANAMNNALGFPYVGKVLSTQIAFGSTKGVDTSSANFVFDKTNNYISIDSGGFIFTGETTFAGIGSGSISRQPTGLTLRGVAGSGLVYNFMLYDPSGNGLLANTAGTQNLVTQFNFGAGLMGVTAPTALVHIKAGTATANTAPLKLTTGVSLTAAEAGAFEYTTPQLFFTNGAAIRQELFQGQQSRVSTQYDNTTTTLGNVTGLTANVAAGKIYRFEAKLYTTSDVAGGIKVAIGGTATATAIRYEGLTTDAGLTTQGRAAALGTAVGAVTAVTAAYVTITGTITVNAAGTLTVQAAANVATGTTSVLTGSTFVITEML